MFVGRIKGGTQGAVLYSIIIVNCNGNQALQANN